MNESASNGFKFGLIVCNSTNVEKHAGLASLGSQLNEALFTIDKSVRVNHSSVIKQLLPFFLQHLFPVHDLVGVELVFLR